MKQVHKRYQETFNSEARRSGIPEADLRIVFEYLPDACLLIDTDFQIVDVNEAYLRATMTKRDDIVGKGIFEAFPDNPSDPGATGVRILTASLKRVLQNRAADAMGVLKYDIRRPKDQGGAFEERYWSPLNSPVFGRDNQIKYIIHRAFDVTDYIRMTQPGVAQKRPDQDRQDRMATEIYTRSEQVADANLKLNQAKEELERLNKRIQELDKIKTAFFANVSHELRTPLTLILGPVEKWLRGDHATEEERHDLEVIKRNALLLSRHVNDLLDVSKLETGAMLIRYTDVDLAHFVRFVGSAFDSFAVEKGIRYSIDASGAVSAQIDPAKFQRVLFNLISNAIKFTPPGGTISISLKTEGADAVIRVQDTGPGIPPEMRQTIFDRFRRLEHGATRRSEGTGLGLTIVKEFTELHRGHVRADEAPGRGALFTVRVPLNAPPDATIEPKSSALEEEALMQGVGELNTLTRSEPAEKFPVAPDAPVILIADDNPEMNAFETVILGRKYRVVSAFNGEEALQKALEIHPDLILTDVMMPRMSGDQMIRELRKHREMDDVPVLLITARADEEFIVDLIKQGVQGYFRKPFSTGELLARADGLIVEKKLKDRLRESHEVLDAIMENVPELLAITDEQGIIRKVSRYGLEMSGLTYDELIGSTAEERGQKMRLYKPDGIAPATDDDMPTLMVLRTGEPVKNWELIIKRRDGRDVPILTNAGPIKDKLGNIRGTVHAWADITERKRAEDELKKAVEGLEQSNKNLQQFAYIASHDLQEPLRTVRSYIEVLGENYRGKLDATAEKYIKYVVDAARHMADLINDLLNFSRIETQSNPFQAVSLTTVLRQTLDNLKSTIDESHAEITSDTLPEIEGDETQLRQVFQNLINNSIKFRKKDEQPRIRISCESKYNYWIIGVHDNGIGIEDRYFERIFAIFQRLHTKEEYAGTGIGLALAKRIVERHRGRIWVESTPGKGSSFYFSLPER